MIWTKMVVMMRCRMIMVPIFRGIFFFLSFFILFVIKFWEIYQNSQLGSGWNNRWRTRTTSWIIGSTGGTRKSRISHDISPARNRKLSCHVEKTSSRASEIIHNNGLFSSYAAESSCGDEGLSIGIHSILKVGSGHCRAYEMEEAFPRNCRQCRDGASFGSDVISHKYRVIEQRRRNAKDFLRVRDSKNKMKLKIRIKKIK